VQDDELFHTARWGGMTGVVASYLIEVALHSWRSAAKTSVVTPAAGYSSCVDWAPGTVRAKALSAEYYYNLLPDRSWRGIRVERQLVLLPASGRPRRTLDEFIFRALRALGIDRAPVHCALLAFLAGFRPLEQDRRLACSCSGYPTVSTTWARRDHGHHGQEIDRPPRLMPRYARRSPAALRAGRLRAHRAGGVRFVLRGAAFAIQQPFAVDANGEGAVDLWAMVNFTLTIGTPHGSILRRFHTLAGRHSGRSYVGKICFDGPAEFRRCYDLERFLPSGFDPEGCF
jgi:hypothetical protein